MSEASRFPHLAPPFAIAGAAAGWLSAGLVANPIVHQAESGVQGVAALFAMVAGAATGLLLTRWCVRKRYRYELDEADPLDPVPTDRWWRHVPAVLVAGAATGATIAVVEEVYHGPMYGALGGLLCALACQCVGRFSGGGGGPGARGSARSWRRATGGRCGGSWRRRSRSPRWRRRRTGRLR
jgi:hypothetical protein